MDGYPYRSPAMQAALRELAAKAAARQIELQPERQTYHGAYYRSPEQQAALRELAAKAAARQIELEHEREANLPGKLPPLPLTTMMIRELYQKYAGNIFWAGVLVGLVYVFGNRAAGFQRQQGL